MFSKGARDIECGRCNLQEGLPLVFGEFFDLNTEVNFCLKEVLELLEKIEEEEDLGLEDIVVV